MHKNETPAVVHRQTAGRRQYQLAPGALVQLFAKFSFELMNLSEYRRWRQVQPLTRFIKAGKLTQRDQRPCMSKLQITSPGNELYTIFSFLEVTVLKLQLSK